MQASPICSIGYLLRTRRVDLGLTQEELAERSGLSVRTIRDLEHGRIAAPRAVSLRLLATSLDLDPATRDQLQFAVKRARLTSYPLPGRAS